MNFTYDYPVSYRLQYPGNGSFFNTISILFHVALFAAPLTARAHAILLDMAWNVTLPVFMPRVTTGFTLTAVISGIILMSRRFFSGHVSAVSSWRDHAAMICVLAPFVSGFLAREFSRYYEILMLTHCLSANLLLAAIGWTRLGHMVFFIAGRIVSFMSAGETA